MGPLFSQNLTGVAIEYIPLEVSAACLHDAQMA